MRYYISPGLNHFVDLLIDSAFEPRYILQTGLFYVGGVNQSAVSSNILLGSNNSLVGCIKDLRFTDSSATNKKYIRLRSSQTRRYV